MSDTFKTCLESLQRDIQIHAAWFIMKMFQKEPIRSEKILHGTPSSTTRTFRTPCITLKGRGCTKFPLVRSTPGSSSQDISDSMSQESALSLWRESSSSRIRASRNFLKV